MEDSVHTDEKNMAIPGGRMTAREWWDDRKLETFQVGWRWPLVLKRSVTNDRD
jgi:hypothetical protein